MSFKRKPPDGNVRRVRSNGQNLRGVITNKAGRLVQFESWAERSLMLQLDRDREVLDYQSQPERFSFSDDQGNQHTYTPDFKVWRQNGVIEIHEVTRSERQVRPEIRRREQAARQICQDRGWRYVVHTEQTLPNGSELANLLGLAGYRPTVYANSTVIQAVYEHLVPHQAMVFRGLVKQFGQQLNLSEAVVTATLCHLLWHGQLQTDLKRLLFDEGVIEAGVVIWIERQGVRHDR